jgi:hypothetical protein
MFIREVNKRYTFNAIRKVNVQINRIAIQHKKSLAFVKFDG